MKIIKGNRLSKIPVFLLGNILLLLIFSASSFSTDYYVSPTGSNSNDGLTPETAWETISHANENHTGGDTVYILPGTYRESYTCDGFNSTLCPKSGSEGAHTTYIGLGDRADIKILGSEAITGWQQCTSGCASDHVYYSNFTSKALRGECYTPNAVPPCPNPVEVDFGDGIIDYYRCTEVNDGTAYTMDCWDENKNWFKRADLDGTRFNAAMGILDVDEPGEYYYDHDYDNPENSRLYLWPFDSGAPSNEIECSQRNNALIQNAYVTIQNLTLMHSPNNGITLTWSAQDINIYNNEIAFNSGGGSCANNPDAIIHADRHDILVPHINIVGNKIHDQGSDKGPVPLDNPIITHAGSGITFYSVKDSLIANNEIYNMADGVYIKYGRADPLPHYDNIIIRNNKVHNVTLRGIFFGDGGPGNTFSGRIEGNLIYNTFFGAGISTNLYNNNVYISGNTLFNTQGIQIEIYGPAGENFYIADNLISGVRPYGDPTAFLRLDNGTLSTTYSDYNLFHNTASYFGLIDDLRYSSFENWKTATNLDSHSIEADPLFVNSSSYDFHLTFDSPGKDKGEIINGYHCSESYEANPDQKNCSNWSGIAPDIGAFEFDVPDNADKYDGLPDPYVPSDRDDENDTGDTPDGGSSSDSDSINVSGGCNIANNHNSKSIPTLLIILFIGIGLIYKSRR